ncbi:glycoside hydrolase family 5 protein [Hydnum rufescens UP504]|uniref:Glycoside hydrolase family 5 protein n=1 Tax=Hydnum rufescens UP504 TaxID=1448309 RepID=A0A9P6BD01_9AGAM|nr:glycoside hydrolase family 5 protein [Hydnum rufescens UP504]
MPIIGHLQLPGNSLSLHGRHFVDSFGRVCLPRGVNISGSSKMPINHNASKFPLGHEEVTFVGRPFALEDAPEHFARLRRWGLTFTRVLVTWEALEHDGPGLHDQAYLEYLFQFLSLMSQFGLCAIVSMHQDVWSRYSGGSGAPAWTLEAVGFDLSKLEETGAAYLGGVKVPGEERERGVWPTGYQKLASSTMWTCFWAGDIFAPKLRVQLKNGEQVGIQAFLQKAFLGSFDVLVRKLRDVDAVIGFEIMNEPHQGYINLPSLHSFDYHTELHFHDAPSALQSFALGAGHPTSVAHYTRSWPLPTRCSHYILRNAAGTSVWRPGGPTGGRCIWEMHGVWGWDVKKKGPIVLREHYFNKHPDSGKEIDWYIDFWVHQNTSGGKILFVEGIPNEFCPPSWTPERRPKNLVFAPHWYDLHTLFGKALGRVSFSVQALSRGAFPLSALYWGVRGLRKNYELQIRTLVEAGYQSLGEVPVIIGECGVPMDLNKEDAFRTGDFSWHERMMDAMIRALERNLIGFTLWTYNPENHDISGDFWNGENFSWFSQSRARRRQSSDLTPNVSLAQTEVSLDEGARLLSAVVRPYPAKVAGIPLSFDYETRTGCFKFRYATPNPSAPPSRTEGMPSISEPPIHSHCEIRCRETEIFVPSSLTRGRRMIIEGVDLKNYKYDEGRQTLFVLHDDSTPGRIHTVHVSFDSPVQAASAFSISTVLLGYVPALIALLVAAVTYHFLL